MRNFLQETKDAIKGSGHTPEDVMFIGSRDGKYRVSFEEFVEIADFTYDNGFGAQEIASDLIIYFIDNSYIARGEYDGSEWWEYNQPLGFKPTDKSKKIKYLCVDQCDRVGWESVEELNSPNE